MIGRKMDATFQIPTMPQHTLKALPPKFFNYSKIFPVLRLTLRYLPILINWLIQILLIQLAERVVMVKVAMVMVKEEKKRVLKVKTYNY